MTHYLVIDEINETAWVSTEDRLFSDVSGYSIEEATRLVIYKIDIRNKKLTRVCIYKELSEELEK